MCCFLTGTHISQSRKEEIILWNLALHAHRIRTFYWSRMRGSTQNWHSKNNNLFPPSYLVEDTKMKNRFYFASKSFQQWNEKCFVNHTQLPALNIVAFTFSPGFFWIMYLYIFSLLSQPIRHFRPKMAVLSCVVGIWRAVLLVFTYNMIVLLIEYSVLRVTFSSNMDSTLLDQQQRSMISFRREQIFLISCCLCFITAFSFIVFLPLEDISWNYVLQDIKKAVLHEDA